MQVTFIDIIRKTYGPIQIYFLRTVFCVPDDNPSPLLDSNYNND